MPHDMLIYEAVAILRAANETDDAAIGALYCDLARAQSALAAIGIAAAIEEHERAMSLRDRKIAILMGVIVDRLPRPADPEEDTP